MQDELHMMEQSATANQQELQDRRAQIAGLKADANQAEVRLQAARKMWEEQLAALKPGDIGAQLQQSCLVRDRLCCI